MHGWGSFRILWCSICALSYFLAAGSLAAEVRNATGCGEAQQEDGREAKGEFLSAGPVAQAPKVSGSALSPKARSGISGRDGSGGEKDLGLHDDASDNFQSKGPGSSGIKMDAEAITQEREQPSNSPNHELLDIHCAPEKEARRGVVVDKTLVELPKEPKRQTESLSLVEAKAGVTVEVFDEEKEFVLPDVASSDALPVNSVTTLVQESPKVPEEVKDRTLSPMEANGGPATVAPAQEPDSLFRRLPVELYNKIAFFMAEDGDFEGITRTFDPEMLDLALLVKARLEALARRLEELDTERKGIEGTLSKARVDIQPGASLLRPKSGEASGIDGRELAREIRALCSSSDKMQSDKLGLYLYDVLSDEGFKAFETGIGAYSAELKALEERYALLGAELGALKAQGATSEATAKVLDYGLDSTKINLLRCSGDLETLEALLFLRRLVAIIVNRDIRNWEKGNRMELLKTFIFAVAAVKEDRFVREIIDEGYRILVQHPGLYPEWYEAFGFAYMGILVDENAPSEQFNAMIKRMESLAVRHLEAKEALMAIKSGVQKFSREMGPVNSSESAEKVESFLKLFGTC